MQYYHTIGKIIGEGWNLLILAMLKTAKCLNFKNATVLDLGCAEGGYCKEALEKGAKKVVCLEQNPIMIERIYKWLNKKSKAKSKMKVHSDDLNDPEIRENLPESDIVFFLNLHHHLLEPIEMLEALAQKTDKIIITNGFQLTTDTAPAPTHGRTKLSSGLVEKILAQNGLTVTNLGEFREGRDLIIGERV